MLFFHLDLKNNFDYVANLIKVTAIDSDVTFHNFDNSTVRSSSVLKVTSNTLPATI